MSKPVTIDGKTYLSQKQAAYSLGVHPVTVHDAIKRGRLDQIGLGRGWRKNQKGPHRGKS